MQEIAYVVIVSVLFIDDIQFTIIQLPNYETFMANMSHETKIILILLFSVCLRLFSYEVEKKKENKEI